MKLPVRKGAEYERLSLAYEARLGRMTLEWNLMETGLDLLVETLFWLHDLTVVKITQRPMSLEQKLTVVRDAHNGIAALAAYKAEGIRLAGAVSDMMQMRHRLTHGYPAHYLANGDVMLLNFRFKPAGPVVEYPIMKAQSIDRLAKKARALFPELVAHVQAMTPSIEEMTKLWPQAAEEAARRVDSAVGRLPASERQHWPRRAGKPRDPPRKGGR